MSWRTGSIALVAVLAGALLVAPSGAADNEFTAQTPPQTAGLPDLDKIDPVRFSYDDAIVEHFQVPTRLNPATCNPSNMATCPSSIWIDVIRPDTDEKVPAIMMSSPYYNTLGRGYKGECKLPTDPTISGPTSPGAPGLSGCGGAQTAFPEWYDEYFVPRGYAYVAMDLYGTRNSSGCQTYGDRDEILTAVDVIDFLADQPWSNGKVGMTGGSYDGTIANGAAVEAPISGRHPDALSAIIPIRAIDAWYDYHWFNGVQSDSHLATPALFTAALAAADTPNSGPLNDPLYAAHLAERKACIATFGAATDAGYAQPYKDADDPFWAERDFVRDAGGIRAATFIVHGLFDFNVKPHNAGWLWDALPPGLPRKLWFLNGDHFDPRCPTEEDCAASNHVVPYPVADEFIEANHRWWLQFLKGVEAGALAGDPVTIQRLDGKLDPSPTFPAEGTTRTYAFGDEGELVPSPSFDEAGTVQWADGPGSGGAPAAVEFLTPPFETETRISGQIGFDLKVATLGPDTTIGVDVDVVAPDAEYDLTFGWIRAWYRGSVDSSGARPVPADGEPMTPNEVADLSFASMHTDVVVPEGGQLKFRFSNNAGGTLPANLGQVVTMSTGADGSTLRLPIAKQGAPAPPRPVPPQPPAPPAPAPRPPAPLPATGGGLPPVALLVAAGAVLLARRLGRT